MHSAQQAAPCCASFALPPLARADARRPEALSPASEKLFPDVGQVGDGIALVGPSTDRLLNRRWRYSRAGKSDKEYRFFGRHVRGAVSLVAARNEGVSYHISSKT
jgi:hypothetical protein